MKVRLTDYTENWKLMFEQEVQLLKTIFGNEIISFEHFGSTSIPGMKAKPVIDMMCIVNDIEKVDRYYEQMKSLEYDVAGEWGIEGGRLFRKGGENRTHHIHFYQFDNPQIERHSFLHIQMKLVDIVNLKKSWQTNMIQLVIIVLLKKHLFQKWRKKHLLGIKKINSIFK